MGAFQRKPMRKLAILLIILAVASCSARIPRINEKVPFTKHPVLFGYSYVNYAWGYQNRGWLINNHGLAKAYNVRERNSWHDPSASGPDSGYISANDLVANYNRAGHLILEFSHLMLYQRIPLIDRAARGELSEPTRTAYDRGQMKYFCYNWDPAKGKYKEVLLSLEGDLTQTNLSPAADTLLEWLKGLDLLYQDSLKAWGE
jgi:hypothetical protein